MILLALIATASAQPASTAPRLVVQATASVRIVSGQRVTFGDKRSDAQLRTTQLREVDGSISQARLTEFQ